MALKFGNDTLIPAMQAGIVSKRLTFRDIFTAVAVLLPCVVMLLVGDRQEDEDPALRVAA